MVDAGARRIFRLVGVRRGVAKNHHFLELINAPLTDSKSQLKTVIAGSADKKKQVFVGKNVEVMLNTDRIP